MALLDYFEILSVVSPTHQLWVFIQFREEVTLQIEHVMATISDVTLYLYELK